MYHSQETSRLLTSSLLDFNLVTIGNYLGISSEPSKKENRKQTDIVINYSNISVILLIWKINSQKIADMNEAVVGSQG